MLRSERENKQHYGRFKQERRQTLSVVTWWTMKSGKRVIRGPVSKMRVGTVKVRQWGKDVPVEVASLGDVFVKDGISLVYGYPIEEETAGQRVG